MKARLWLLPLVALVAAACTANDPITKKRPGSNDPNDPNDPSDPNDPNHQPEPKPSAVCGVSKLGKPQLRRLTAREFVRTLEDVFPEVKGQWTSSLTADSISHYGFDNDASRLVVGKQTAQAIADTAESVAAAVSGSALSTILPCSASSADRNCAGEFITKYGRRLFRRSVRAEEQSRYLGLFDQALPVAGFAGAIGWVTRGLIQSPATVYRSEVGTFDPANPKRYTLSVQEIATQLSYTYAGTTPSDAVLAGAEAGQIDDAASRIAGANVLLSGSNNQVLERFFESWIGYGRVVAAEKTTVPTFANVRSDMLEETRRFIQEVVINQRGGTRELLLAPFTTPTVALASFYGIPAPAADYARVDRPAGRGIGLFAQGSVLSSLALSNGSSPTKRGLMVMERFLCRERPTVPNNVPILPNPNPGVVTTRQRYEQAHASVSPCKECHAQFDPIGFGFEHYDEVGRYRDSEGGLPIDAASHVPGDDGVLFSFKSLEELAQGLANEPRVAECVSGYLTTYAFGGPDECLGETRRAEFIESRLGFLDYFASLAGEPHFAERELP